MQHVLLRPKHWISLWKRTFKKEVLADLINFGDIRVTRTQVTVF